MLLPHQLHNFCQYFVLGSGSTYDSFIMPPTSKKLMGEHIGLGLCVRACVRYALHMVKRKCRRRHVRMSWQRDMVVRLFFSLACLSPPKPESRKSHSYQMACLGLNLAESEMNFLVPWARNIFFVLKLCLKYFYTLVFAK